MAASAVKLVQAPQASCHCAGDGKCVVCDSYVRPATLVRICDECNYGSYAGRCVICGGVGISDAYYCKECTVQEKDVRPLWRIHLLACCVQTVLAGAFGLLRMRRVAVHVSLICSQSAPSPGWCVAVSR